MPNQSMRDELMGSAYRVCIGFISRDLLELMKPNLNEVEAHFVNKWAPKIYDFERMADEALSVHGSPEGRAWRRKAKTLTEASAQKFKEAEIPEERRALLQWLVSHSFNIKDGGHDADRVSLEHLFRRMKETGRCRQLRELADQVEAPPAIKAFLFQFDDFLST